MIGTIMRRIVSVLAISAMAASLVTISTTEADAQSSMRRRPDHRPIVPRSQSRRAVDRAAERDRPQMYVPGHWAWNTRRGEYSWVSGRWERYDPNHAFVGTGLVFRNGQWTFGPAR
jgi:Ni/Co efflux regulator RcnB